MIKDHTEREKKPCFPSCITFYTACWLAITCPPLLLYLWDHQCPPVDKPISSNMHVWKCQCYILWKLGGSGCLQSHNETVFSVLSKEALPGDFTQIRFVRAQNKTQPWKFMRAPHRHARKHKQPGHRPLYGNICLFNAVQSYTGCIGLYYEERSPIYYNCSLQSR